MKLRYLGIALGIILVLLPTAALAQPVIPHAIEGRNDCLMCHETGIAGAPRVPADHAGRNNSTCLICHRVAAGEAPTPAPTATPRPAVTPIVSPKEPPAKPGQVPATGDETPILLVVLGGLFLACLGWGMRGRWATN